MRKTILLALTALLLASCCNCECFEGCEDPNEITFEIDLNGRTGLTYDQILNIKLLRYRKGDTTSVMEELPFGSFWRIDKYVAGDGFENYDYAVYSEEPYFKYLITDIELEGKKKGMCQCYDNTRKDFKLNGQSMTATNLPIHITLE